jgi:hypothetical protein
VKYLLIVAIIVVMVSGCAPEAADEGSESTAVSLNRSSELKEINDQPRETIDEGDLEEIDVQPGELIDTGNLVADSGPEAAEPPASLAQDGDPVAPSGNVDLSELTSPSSGNLDAGELVIQPAPGNPETQPKMEELAREDLANRLEIAIDEIVTVSIELVEWPDGSLGCAERGKMYIQVLTPGYLILLESDGEQFEYHSDTNSNVILCEDGRPVSSD